MGSGPDKEKYEALIKSLGAESKIKLLGRHPSPTEYIKDSYAFLLSSSFEGMPNALLEAMAVGLPSISTDCGGGGAAALIENGKNGLLTPRDDEEAFTAAILRLMEDEAFAEALGNEALGVNERLSPERITDEWEAMCKSILKK